MEIISERTYNVMDGEPHLGKQTEIVVGVSRDEYLEGLVDAFTQGCEFPTDDFDIEDRDLGLIQPYQLGNDLTEAEIDEILEQREKKLLDDDYGSDKEYTLLYDLLDALIDDDWEDEFEVTQMRGY